MAKIKVLSKCELYDGMSITFRAPCDCTAVDGLKVYYNEYSQSFSFRDAQGSNLAGLDGLFAEGAYIKAILDTGHGYAYLQNADTNTYIENKYKSNFFLKNETLSDATKTMYGLGADATPNTVFQKLAMPYGYYGFDITTVFEDGSIAPNIVLNGLEDFSGNTVQTDENGRCEISVSATPSPTVSISGYLDVVDKSVSITAEEGTVFTPITIVLTKNEQTYTTETSTTMRITGAAVYDFTVIGGGGGGGGSQTGYKYGAGGGGGYITTSLNNTLRGAVLKITVGAGGSGSTYTGGNGGASSVSYDGAEVIVSAEGGGGGSTSPGVGNGNGNGGDAVGYLFDDESLGIPGGGGGSVSNLYGYSNPGGSPYGGAGSWSRGDDGGGPQAGRGPGGGGGGAAAANERSGAKGYGGKVYVRVRFSS